MNVITKSGNLSSYFRVTTQLVGASAKTTSPIIPAHENTVPKSLDIVQSSLNNALAAQTTIVGGELITHFFLVKYNLSSSVLLFYSILLNIAIIFIRHFLNLLLEKWLCYVTKNVQYTL